MTFQNHETIFVSCSTRHLKHPWIIEHSMSHLSITGALTPKHVRLASAGLYVCSLLYYSSWKVMNKNEFMRCFHDLTNQRFKKKPVRLQRPVLEAQMNVSRCELWIRNYSVDYTHKKARTCSKANKRRQKIALTGLLRPLFSKVMHAKGNQSITV